MTLLLRQRAASVLLFVSAALVGCGDDTSGPPVADTQAQATGGDLVSAAQSGTLESTQGMSTAPPGSGGAAPDQSLDIASLGYNEGPADAPVRVLEFSDFGCGYCRRFHEESYPALVEEYMEAGKVEWKYVPIILGMFPNAMEAARAGECAGEQGAFPRMRDLLFERQSDWKGSNDPEPMLEGYARELDLDVARFRQCVNERWRDQRIQAGTQLSRQVGVRGTPTFFVVGYAPIPGAIPLDLFRAALDTVYAQSMREPEGG
jgi:protein-disulfide isomerase